MNVKNVLRALIILGIMISNVSCDQISKNFVRKKISYFEEIALVNNHVTLMKIENPGAFLSVGASLPQPFRILMLIVFPVAALIFAFVYVLVTRSLSNRLIASICFIVGGGFGNLYDRIIYGSVTDFLHIDFVLFQTAVFNMADVSIMIGIALMGLELLMERKKYFHNS